MKLKMYLSQTLLAASLLAAVFAARAQTQPAPAPAPTNAPKGAADDLFADRVIAKGVGVEIRQSRLDEAMASVKANAVSRNQEINPARMPMLEKQVFDNLLMNQLLAAQATDEDRAKGKAEGDKEFDLIKKRALNEETLVKQLKAIGLTEDKLHAQLIEDAVPMAVLRKKVTITPEEVKRFYADHPSDFEEPEMVRASHILLQTGDLRTGVELSAEQKAAKLKQIEELLKRARAGEDFEQLAAKYSEDEGSRNQGGEYTFPRGKMMPAFEAAAFSLKTNQISDVVTTSYGFHIIKMLERIPARKLEFEKAKVDIEDYLARQKIDALAPGLYVSMRKEAKVEILDPRLKSMSEDDTTGVYPGAALPAPK